MTDDYLVRRDQRVNVKEAAATLKVSPRTVQRWIATGRVTAWKDEDGRLWIPIDALTTMSQDESAPGT